MAVGYSAAFANAQLDSLVTNYPHVQWHTGEPGAAGTANAAAETDRVDISSLMGSATGGVKTSTSDLDVTGVAASEDWTHFTMWSATSGGTFGASGTVTADAVTIGNNFTIPAGSFVLTQPIAS